MPEKNAFVLQMLKVLRDLHTLKRPLSTLLSRKHDTRPFEDQAQTLARMADKEDASLFALANSNKKRPDNLVIGCTHDGHLLDMVELGVSNFKPLAEFKTEKVTFHA